MTVIKWTYVIFLVILGFSVFKSCSGQKNPSIKILNNINESEWKLVHPDGERTLLSEMGDDLFITCEAPSPIQWKITGHIGPVEIVKILPPKRDLDANKFQIGINMFFLDGQSYSGFGASAQIACKYVNSSKMLDRIYVFVKGKNVFIKPESNTVTDSLLIPCPTTDPTVSPKLYLQQANRQRQIHTAKYNPIAGFESTSVFDGSFECRKDNEASFVTITANITPSTPGFQFSPSSEEIKVFSNEIIELKCTAESGSMMMEISDRSNLTVVHSKTESREKNVQISMKDKNFDSGKRVATCISEQRRVKQWSFEYIASPSLYLDNFEGEVDCLSEHSRKSVQTVRCINSMHCRYMSHCLRNVSYCNFKKQKQFSASQNTNCWVEMLQSGKSCASVPYSHFNGLAQCTIGGLKKTWEFFVSLDFLKYSDWRDAPERELLRMDEVMETLYTNDSTKFFCMGSAYLFTDSISFEMESKNGTRTLLLMNDNSIANITNPSSENPRKIDEFNVIGTLDIFLPFDTVAIHCLAPWWNSTDIINTSRRFETKHLIAPTLTGASSNNAETRFYTGNENQRLTCYAQGEPRPIYKWSFKRETDIEFKNVTKVFPELKTSLGSNGEGYLEFPKPKEEYSGEFRCVAENRVDKATRTFKLNVTDEPISAKSVVYIVAVVVILLILVLVLAALSIYMRRYNEAKELVRSLTDSEIDEFFTGRPELLQNAMPSVDTIDFLPYNKSYEIPVDDMEFDSTDENLLGTGEFAYVVRGRIISRSKDVAVKISKPSADVALFKSLLSEVKIMIYIGEHENVIKLVGVCTHSIRNRCIYIATDICTLGSLDKFLRKGRKDFVNLMDANQEIDIKLLRNESTHVSTLDLIKFAAQIAKGMEYLAHKSVIHADLAGRNILLTADRTVKISDFGLSKKLYESNNYVKKSKSPLPWRWMAVESLTTLTFSTKSDVWGYGATLFEVFTMGDIPFPNEEWDREFVTRLATGMRMGRPKYSTQEIYSKIVTCWESEPDHRPHFSSLRTFFELMLGRYQSNYPSQANLTSKTDSKHVDAPQVIDVIEKVGNAPIEEPIYANFGDTSLEATQFESAMYVNTDAEIAMAESEKSQKPSYINIE